MERCKKVIGREHVTFRSLVEEGLDRVLSGRTGRKPFTLKSIPFRGGGFQPGFDESDWSRIRDAAYEGRGS